MAKVLPVNLGAKAALIRAGVVVPWSPLTRSWGEWDVHYSVQDQFAEFPVAPRRERREQQEVFLLA